MEEQEDWGNIKLNALDEAESTTEDEEFLEPVLDEEGLVESERGWDEFKNAPEFVLWDDVFETPEERKEFNFICKKIEDEIILVKDHVNNQTLLEADFFHVHENYIKFGEQKRQKTLHKRIVKTDNFLKVAKNRYKFTRWIKYFCLHLLFGKKAKYMIRYSRKGADYSGVGQYAKMHIRKYDPFMLISDILELLGYIEQDLGEEPKEEITRAWFTESGKKLFERVEDSLLFKQEFKKNKRNTHYDLVRLTEKLKKPKDENVDPKVKGKVKKKSDNKKTDKKESSKKTEGKKLIPLRSKVYISDSKFRPLINKLNELEDNVNNINQELNKHKLILSVDNISINTSSLLDTLYIDHLSTRIDDLQLICTINVKDIKKEKYICIDKIKRNKKVIIIERGEGEEEKEGDRNMGRYIPVKAAMVSRKFEELESEVAKCPLPEEGCIHIHHLSFVINSKDLFRVFSRGNRNYPLLNKCGRFYGGYWINMKRELRKHLYADDDTTPMVSLDFSAMHLRLCYHLEGIPYIGDPYEFEKDGIIYQGKREWYKRVSLVSLNARNEYEAKGAIKSKLEKELYVELDDDEVDDLFKSFKDKHDQKVVEKYFCKDFATNYGMYYDSMVMEDAMLELMVKRGIVVLVEHDELMCKVDDVYDVRQQMIESYIKILRPVLLKSKVIKEEDEDLNGLCPEIPLPKNLDKIIRDRNLMH